MATITTSKAQNMVTSYRAKVRLKGYPITSSTFSRLTDARFWAQKGETQIREGIYFTSNEARKRSVDELVDRYPADVVPSRKETSAPKRVEGGRIGQQVAIENRSSWVEIYSFPNRCQ